MKSKVLLIYFITVFLSNFIVAQSNSQKVIVTGYITDTNNKPVQDAVILVDNVKLDTYVNSKGFYKIKIPASTKNIMAFSVKHGLKEHLYNGEPIVNFVFGTANLDATVEHTKDDKQVNIGYGTVKKSNLTSGVGSVEINENTTYRNIYDMIIGKVPGVTVTGNRIIIRGLSSINAGTEPLYVVDGSVTNSISDIPPSQVEDISILKGSEAAMYGARGANGVIVITLKKAKKAN